MIDGRFEVGNLVRIKPEYVGLLSFYHNYADCNKVMIVRDRSTSMPNILILTQGNSKFAVPESALELVPQYSVGQYVKFSTPNGNGYGIIVGKIGDMWDICAFDRYQSRWQLCECDIVAVPPSEVIIDFGSGIKGRIQKDTACRNAMSPSDVCHIIVTEQDTDFWHKVFVDSLTDPMRTIVTDLLEAQAKEASND